MEDVERRKVVELLKEMKNENEAECGKTGKNENRLNWMYKGSSDLVDREEYLLGKAIDKSFEMLNNAGSSDALIGRTSEQSNVPKRLLGKTDNTEQVDIAKKILEDPLYAIKQKELEARKKLLNNPVKLKQIKQMLLDRNKKTGSHKKQKKKKLKKNETSSEALDQLILRKLKKFSEKEKRKALNRVMQSDSDYSSSDSSSSDEEEKKKQSHPRKKRKRSYSSSEESDSSSETSTSSDEHKKKKIKRRKRSKKCDSSKNKHSKQSSISESSSSDSSSSDDPKRKKSKRKRNRTYSSSESSSSTSESVTFNRKEKVRYKKNGTDSKSSHLKHKNDKSTTDRNRQRNKGLSHKESYDKNREHVKRVKYKKSSKESYEEDLRKKKNYGLMMPDGSKPVSERRQSPIKKYEKKAQIKTKYVPPPKAKPLSEKEAAAKLKEMMKNAKIRKEDREKNLANYRKTQSRENEMETYDGDFMRRQMSHLTSQGTMADRIKSNINNIQRSKSSMDSSFVRK